MQKLTYLKDVVTLSLNKDKCTSCGVCLEVCPRNVLVRNNGSVDVVDRDACIECGACALNCPFAAISVKAGVGCAMAVINAALGRKGSSCCCTMDTKDYNMDKQSGSSCGC
ncbi:MAG: mercury methylation ferredoxin HgcB [Desulfomonilaceae bacterium]